MVGRTEKISLASSEMFSHHYGNMQMQMIPLREMPLHNIIIPLRQKSHSLQQPVDLYGAGCFSHIMDPED